jgi:hypothetical protein
MTACARFSRAVVFLVLAVLGLAAPAHAAVTVLVTPSVTSAPGDTAYCRIVNVGTVPITVRIEHLGVFGTHYGDDFVLVRPGEVGIRDPFVLGIAMNVHCRFSGQFIKTSVRASIDVVPSTTNRSVVVAPAR